VIPAVPAEDDQVIAFTRNLAAETILFPLNFQKNPCILPVDAAYTQIC
jgi:hypothetical protein